MAISGIGVAYVGAGMILIVSGYKNATLANTLKGVLKGQIPSGAPTGAPTVSLGNASSTGTGSTGNIPASTPGTISYSAAESYWTMAGGPSALAPTMAAIASAESGLQPGVIQQGQPYDTTGWGLRQITPGNSEPQIGIDKALLSPLTNARAAVAKYNSGGLSQWTTYTSGAYQQYMH
jgi:hypothetical protein